MTDLGFTPLGFTQLCLIVALLLCLVRVFLGPSAPDRVVALDLAAVISSGFLIVDAVETGERSVLIAGVALALVALVGTVGFAFLIERMKP